MSSNKISNFDLEGHVSDKIANTNIRTYTDLSQIGLEVGKETFYTIMEALPEHSILQLAVTENYNTEIYPYSIGTCIIEDIYTTGATFRFYATVDDVPRIWKGIYVNNAFTGWVEAYTTKNPPTVEDIKGAVSADYVDQQIATVTSTGIPKLQVYPMDLIYAEDGQTEFEINLSTFDINTDTVLVQKGMLLLNPNGDYTIEGNKVVLSEATFEDQTIGIWVWKNVALGEDGSVSGKCIADGSLSLSALKELPTAEDIGALKAEDLTITSDIPLHFGINESGGLTITYDDGK